MKSFSIRKGSLVVIFSVIVIELFSQTFTEQTSIILPGVNVGNATWGDYDNDGDLDILIGGSGSDNFITAKVFRNNGSNVFTEQTSIFLTPLPSVSDNFNRISLSWTDFDNDGYLDIIFSGYTTTFGNVILIYRNETNNTFSLRATIDYLTMGTGTVEPGDYDNDGDLDFVLITTSATRIFQNKGSFVFEDQTSVSIIGLIAGDSKWGDYDNDGDLDLLLTGKDGTTPTTAIYQNQGNNNFVRQTQINLTNIFAGASGWGDYNNDGYLDILLAGNYNYGVFKNNGNNTFSYQSAIVLSPVTYAAGRWADLDNDGDLDIIYSGDNNGTLITKIYINNGNNTFSQASSITIEAVREGSIDLLDIDNDNDLDLLITGNKGISKISKVYLNTTPAVNSVPVAPTMITSSVVGSEVILKWNRVSNDNTSKKSITYTVMAGTSAGAINLVSPGSSTTTGARRISGMGNGQLDTTFILRNIKKGTYYWKVQAVDNSYKGSPFSAQGSFTYNVSIQAFGLKIVKADGKTARLSWSRGNGVNCIVFMKEGSTGTISPVNNTTFTASSVFKSGTQLGAGWYCVYKGTQGIANVTGLTPKTNYIFQVFEFDGIAPNEIYNTQIVAGNPFVFKTGIFTEITASTLLPVNSSSLGFEKSTSNSWFDFDNDNDLDLLLVGSSASLLYRNDGNDIFTLTPVTPGTGFSAATADYNNNGFTDFIVDNDPLKLYLNNGNSTFTEQSSLGIAGTTSGSVSWGDYDNDGDLDLALQGRTSSGVNISRIFRNNGNNTFTEQTAILLAGVSGIGSSIKWGDYNNDGFLDLLLTGQDNSGTAVTKIYRNNTNGNFVEQTNIQIPTSYGSTLDWGDYDNDGDLDIVLAKSPGPSVVYRNEGNDTLKLQTNISLMDAKSGSVSWGDYDNDGDLDILISGFNNQYLTQTKIYKNNGDNTFTEDSSCLLPGIGWGSSTWGDYDKDGDLDIVLSGVTTETSVSKIFRNDISVANTPPLTPTGLDKNVVRSDVTLTWRSVRSDNTPYKAMSYNIRVGSTTGGINIVSPHSAANGFRKQTGLGNANLDTTFILKKLPFGNYFWSVQAIDNGFASSPFATEGTFSIVPVQASKLSAKIIDKTSLKLKWERGNGDRCVVFCKQTSTGVAVPLNNTGYIADPEYAYGGQIGSSGWYCLYNGRADSVVVTGLVSGLQYSFHIFEYLGTFGSEQYFTQISDGNPGVFTTSLFSEQSGITINPVWDNNVAWGDYDNDGLIDVLVPGNPTRIYRNKGNNTFEEKTGPGISFPNLSVGAVAWGDYDSDGDLDIIMTGASSNPPISNPVTKIYRNVGPDNFTEQAIALAPLFYSSVAWGDYDNDGDLDILLNGASGTDPNYIPVSKVYDNNNNNTFTENTKFALTGLYRGSVRWVDYDNDGDLDIAMTGAIPGQFFNEGYTEIYKNNGDKTFALQTDIQIIGRSRSATSWGDFDNDGDLDLTLTTEGYLYIYQNMGANNFTKLTEVSLSWINSCYSAWGDYDNDGWLDIILTNPGLDTRIYRNTHGLDVPGALAKWFKEQDDEAVKSVGYSFVNWIDYDNDGDLDFLMSKDASIPTKIYRNNLIMKSASFKPNSSPAAPTGLKAINSREGIKFSWNPAQDSITPSKTLTYNVKVGTSRTNFNVTPSHSSPTGFRKIAAMGNAQLDTSYLMKNMPAIKYYWRVQAVDQGLKGGEWSEVDSAVVKNVLAFFSADTVCHGLATTFTNQSVAFGEVILGYEWIFGDGATSALTSPTHIFSTAGIKDVTLISYSATTRDTLTKQVLVKAKPLVDFSATVACQGTETKFDNLSINSGLNIISWSWNYGDGKGSTDFGPVNHGYLVSGDYQVKLTALADNSCSSFLTKTVTVAAKPVAVISSNDNLTFCSDASVTLSVNTGANFLYSWMRDDAVIPGANSPSHTDNRSGMYSVKVTNSLASNCDNTSSKVTLTSSPKPAIPQIITENYSGVNQCPGTTPITLRVDQSYTGYSYQWTRNGTPVSNATATSYTGLLAAGDYTVIATQATCKSESSVKTIAYAAAPEIPEVHVRGPVVWYMATSTKAYKEYKWYFNNQLIAGATKYIYVANKQLGIYRVEVANEQGGCLTSSKDVIIPVTKSGMTDFNIPAEYLVAGDIDPFAGMNIYPNPGNGLFFIEMDNQQRGDLLISIYGYDGKELFKIKSIKDSDFHKETINLTGQPKGNYLIKIDLNNISTVKKIILE